MFNIKEIEALFIEVCTIDVQAIKPGNVSLQSPGAKMCAADFIRSAEVCAPALCRGGATLGERILDAIKATRTVVDCNTNLGIVLLCAPLIQAAFDFPDDDLRHALAAVLERTTVRDAVFAYRAIRMAQPGGMGQVGEGDLADEPTVDLRTAMALASDRDLIAAQYADGYSLLFDEVMPLLLEFKEKWGYPDGSATGAYLALLGRYPDSLVARRHGLAEAQNISAEAASLSESFAGVGRPDQFKPQLLEFDRRLKRAGINPGTTADLVITGLFIAGLRALHCAERIPA